MKNCIVMAVMLLGFWGLYVAFHTPPDVGNGVELKRNCGASIIWNDVACQSYVGGVAQGIFVAEHPAICFPSNFDSEQALPIVRRYMVTHPEILAAWSPHIVQGAFRAAYPCRWRTNAMAGRSD